MSIATGCHPERAESHSRARCLAFAFPSIIDELRAHEGDISIVSWNGILHAACFD